MEFMGIDPTSTPVFLLYAYDWQMMSVLPHFRHKIKWFAKLCTALPQNSSKGAETFLNELSMMGKT
ncbi:hypothetical protein NC653_039541 [Populus alba x Populus x berolinensis]|uniref:Uncharacterized protein n=1 Tax=Populus alba x Populus x berolinensis TaxID=444605 RepID=A0AAD6LBF6_9ROSI|nr:hypothetical protein NC653_039541 [Populus alba x Populus x berolinensis]